jgi:hypothetical protein
VSRVDTEDAEDFGVCKNPSCVSRGQRVALHETGLCAAACCPRYGALGCDDCDWEGLVDDE